MATSTAGRPRKHNPTEAKTDGGKGIAPVSPGAALVRNNGQPFTWMGSSSYGPVRQQGYISPELKREMNQDDTVAQCKSIFEGLALDTDPRLFDAYPLRTQTPQPYEQANYDNSRRVTDFIEYCYSNVVGNMYQFDYQLLQAAFCGLKVAVIVARLESYSEQGRKETRWVLDHLQMLDEGEFTPWLDNSGRLIGLQVHDQRNDDGTPKVWGLDKFVVSTFRPVGSSIWGSDLDVPAYLMYVLKNKGWEQYYAAIQQVGTPTAWHNIREGASTAPTEVRDVDGNLLFWTDAQKSGLSIIDTGNGPAKMSAAEAQQYRLKNGIGNGMVVFVDGELHYLQAQDSQTIPGFVEAGTIGIHRAYLGTDKFAMRGTHESSGSSQAGERIASFTAAPAKAMLEGAHDQINRTLTKWNYGADMVHYRPRTDFGSGLSSQIPQLINSLSALASTRIASIYQIQDRLMNECGFPQAQAAELAEVVAAQAQAVTGGTGAANGSNAAPGVGSKDTQA